MRIYLGFFCKRILTNFLALFLVCLSVASGEEVEHEFPHNDIQLSEIEYDFVDFPTSRVRNNAPSYLNLQRIADNNDYKFDFNGLNSRLFSDSLLKKITQIHIHPLILHLVKIVVCKNAP